MLVNAGSTTVFDAVVFWFSTSAVPPEAVGSVKTAPLEGLDRVIDSALMTTFWFGVAELVDPSAVIELLVVDGVGADRALVGRANDADAVSRMEFGVGVVGTCGAAGVVTAGGTLTVVVGFLDEIARRSVVALRDAAFRVLVDREVAAVERLSSLEPVAEARASLSPSADLCADGPPDDTASAAASDC